ncbi:MULTISPECIES: transposase [unclassified Carboxylicivirga]|uniref:transposase n=1 Tax=Carboxylicivirga TaxID=1628153 RepID=UPI003D33321D
MGITKVFCSKGLQLNLGRSTNAAAESFNAKIKDFRRQFRGVKDVNFFLYRLCKIYA